MNFVLKNDVEEIVRPGCALVRYLAPLCAFCAYLKLCHLAQKKALERNHLVPQRLYIGESEHL